MKRPLFISLLVCVLALPMFAAHPATTEEQPPAGALKFPVVATNQSRPRTVTSNFEQDPWTGGDYGSGACNCKRECTTTDYRCKLRSSNDYKCLSSTSSCSTCDRTDCGE